MKAVKYFTVATIMILAHKSFADGFVIRDSGNIGGGLSIEEKNIEIGNLELYQHHNPEDTIVKSFAASQYEQGKAKCTAQVAALKKVIFYRVTVSLEDTALITRCTVKTLVE